MSVQNLVKNDLVQEASGVWFFDENRAFAYSDGVESERYLERIFKQAKDLSSRSSELEDSIKDWPSEYHLTVKRAQLFAGFDFDPSLRVLEVGCGCGAITRYLGEHFKDVVSIEGSMKRARLARLRTKDLSSVSIISAPFQEIMFTRKFNLIFCIGVYEYSASFVPGEDPYDSVLAYFNQLLSPDGIVIIAIENQFGLKYWNASREDHLGTKFDGLEGYLARKRTVKTFGKHELERRLKKYFKAIKFYYPYPDYKLPDGVVSDDFLSSGRAGELVSQFKSCDYSGKTKNLWHESLVSLELSKNQMLPFFSNSFLVFAGKYEIKGCLFNQLAILFSSKRVSPFRTKTRIYQDEQGKVIVSKKLLSGDREHGLGKLSVHESFSVWQDTHSLQTVLFQNCASKGMTLAEIFSGCRAWLDYLEGASEEVHGEKFLPGEYVDYIFSNIYLGADGLSIIDKEWVWHEKVRLNVVVIRAIYTFLDRLEEVKTPVKTLRSRSLKRLIMHISKSIGLKLSHRDFMHFVEFQSEFQSLIQGSDKMRNRRLLQWILLDRFSFSVVRSLKNHSRDGALRIRRLMSRLY